MLFVPVTVMMEGGSLVTATPQGRLSEPQAFSNAIKREK